MLRILLAGALMLVLLSACSSAPGDVPPKDVSADADYDGKEVEVAMGGSVIVTLVSNPSTGYQWKLAEKLDEAVLKLAHSKYQASEAATPGGEPIGAPGKEVWTFEAVGKGEAVVSLEYVRPWEEGVPAVETFELTVVVR